MTITVSWLDEVWDMDVPGFVSGCSSVGQLDCVWNVSEQVCESQFLNSCFQLPT